MKFSTIFALMFAAIPSMMSASAYTYTEPVDTSTVDTSGWKQWSGATQLTWASKNVHYRQRMAPSPMLVSDTLVTAWRGERLGMEALLVSPEGSGELSLKLSDMRSGRKTVKAPGSSASFMRYVLANSWPGCGYPPDTLPAFTLPDMIDLPDASVAVDAQTVRPVWVTVEVPRDIAPGVYAMTLQAVEKGSKKVVGSLTLNVKVLDRTLPASEDMAFYLDLWQQPYSVARYYGVEPWSDKHLELMRPYMEKLARAGQKAVSVILFYEPWGEQSNDKFEPMVKTVRGADGSWKFDYTIFDRWVDYMDSMGINANLECFTMVPWQPQYRYIDEPTGELRYLEAKPGSEAYNELWSTFLKDFSGHLRSRGLFDKTMIAMDERGLNDMLAAYRIARETEPELKMSLAGSYHQELVDSLYAYTLIKGDFFPADVMKRRHDRDQLTLMYTCCATPAPSQFTTSAPADGAYIPVYATATGHDGYLHWSYMNWTDNPLEDTRFHMFAPGDTYFIYPDGRSSVRYERMVEGIQMSEKLRLLREEMTAANDIEGLLRLENALLPIRTGALNEWYPTSTVVDQLQEAIDALSQR
ncbi:MAG: DUF4091 domain-containing protein [Bacteroides sp.]|nr:DUF4091 domain-containing protein [Bacteroides sp.]MCM1413562.1 DUF4091 domain-containing protein [Bacteroides sp.]MCM1471116.1 DUF4091 domain-containing protein [Bacteroides sp.]